VGKTRDRGAGQGRQDGSRHPALHVQAQQGAEPPVVTFSPPGLIFEVAAVLSWQPALHFAMFGKAGIGNSLNRKSGGCKK